MVRVFMFITALCVASAAQAMTPVKDESAFRDLVVGKTLVLRLYGIKLNVRGDGTIRGSALTRDVTGTWSWIDGFFCREMKWGSRVIPYNCQLVEYDGKSVRFTVDQGAGDSADFVLR